MLPEVEPDDFDADPIIEASELVEAGIWRRGVRCWEARAAFERLLWLNPEDHQGARFALAKILAGAPWSAD